MRWGRGGCGCVWRWCVVSQAGSSVHCTFQVEGGRPRCLSLVAGCSVLFLGEACACWVGAGGHREAELLAGAGQQGKTLLLGLWDPTLCPTRWWTHGALLFLFSSPECEAWRWGVGRLGHSGFVPAWGTGETLEPSRDSLGIPRTCGFAPLNLPSEWKALLTSLPSKFNSPAGLRKPASSRPSRATPAPYLANAQDPAYAPQGWAPDGLKFHTHVCIYFHSQFTPLCIRRLYWDHSTEGQKCLGLTPTLSWPRASEGGQPAPPQGDHLCSRTPWIRPRLSWNPTVPSSFFESCSLSYLLGFSWKTLLWSIPGKRIRVWRSDSGNLI